LHHPISFLLPIARLFEYEALIADLGEVLIMQHHKLLKRAQSQALALQSVPLSLEHRNHDVLVEGAGEVLHLVS
jgi:hypothetical protein